MFVTNRNKPFTILNIAYCPYLLNIYSYTQKDIVILIRIFNKKNFHKRHLQKFSSNKDFP